MQYRFDAGDAKRGTASITTVATATLVKLTVHVSVAPVAAYACYEDLTPFRHRLESFAN